MRIPFPCLAGLAALLLACPAAAQQPAAPPPTAPAPGPTAPARPLLGDQSDGSRARPVHAIPLRDPEGEVIRPTDRPLLPFSPSQTCAADCHDVKTVARGWHFNPMAPGPQGGRPGEPWILVDPETATQLPLSYHGWKGTYRPEQVDVTPWKFAKLFGGRTAGGITGEREPSAAMKARWAVSGDLEVNCLACHDASPAYDHSEYGRQVALENFRWAGASASGLALVTGAAREMPNSFDYLLPSVEDALRDRMPTVGYAPERFLPGAKMVFDIQREVPARRCYYCHSNADVEHTGQGRWRTDHDVHLARGMTCVDCHRSGLDHAMTRGYEATSTVPGAAATSCRGCHMAGEADRVFAGGRLGAPYPRHEGLPPIHLSKLACTACHSGPAPAPVTRTLKTSQAHRLGGVNVNKASDVLPHLYYPVFARQDDGTTTPNRLLWPAFWGRLSNGGVTPIAPEQVKRVLAKGRLHLKPSATGTWPTLDEALLARILRLLGSDSAGGGVPVYVAGGRLHRLNAAGGIASEEHAAARPYLWQMAHDVRPASLALGARGCQDCHDANAPIFFGKVTVDSPLASDGTTTWSMARFQKDLDTRYLTDFAGTFRYRPWLKGTLGVSAAVLLLFCLAYGLPGLARLSAAAGVQRWKSVLVNLVGLAACAVSVATGYPALLSGQPLTGYRLMLHVGSAPVFTVAAVVAALFWAERNRFNRGDWNRVRRPFGAAHRHAGTPYLVLLRKLAFWAALVSAIPAIVSMTLAMFPVLASVYQGALFTAHRYSVWPLAAASAAFVAFGFLAWLQALWLARKRTTPDMTAPQV